MNIYQRILLILEALFLIVVFLFWPRYSDGDALGQVSRIVRPESLKGWILFLVSHPLKIDWRVIVPFLLVNIVVTMLLYSALSSVGQKVKLPEPPEPEA